MRSHPGGEAHTRRMLALAVVLAGLAGVGAVVGIARAYMDTAPELDLTLIDEQAHRSSLPTVNPATGEPAFRWMRISSRISAMWNLLPARLRNTCIRA